MNGTPVQLSRKSKGNEWPNTLTLADLVAMQWQPVAIQQFILKVHSRCNLKCDYCYIYEMDDSSWLSQPAHMAPEVAQQAANRILEHVLAHDIPSVQIILHGGEPLLAGRDRLARFFEIFHTTLGPSTSLSFAIQTNGLLLSDDMVQLLATFGVTIGVSLDGPEWANDRHRRRPNGHGSFQQIAENLEALQAGPHANLFSGFLATIDVTNDPVAVYDGLCEFDPPSISFLLPHGTWASPPPDMLLEGNATIYADWLIAIFDRWFYSSTARAGIRLFDQILRMLHGLPSTAESIGPGVVAIATIETDGSFAEVDTLKSVYDGAAGTELNVFDHNVDLLLQQPGVAARQLGLDGLSETCKSCSIVSVCGGGYFPHRYRTGSGFLNPSVYCHDLQKLIEHITDAVAKVKVPSQGGLSPK